MTTAKQGDTVKVHYIGKLVDGTIFDQSAEDDPLEFTIGEGDLIPGFEKLVIGMEIGQTRSGTIPADDAYGPHQEGLVLHIDRAAIPEDVEPEVGQELEIEQANGENFSVMVTEVSESAVTLDGNHPLAGQDLVFEISLVEIGA